MKNHTIRTHAVAASLLSLLLVPANSLADEKQDVAQLAELISRVEKILPAGWVVEFELTDDRCHDSQASLVIKSVEKLPVEDIAQVGLPAREPSAPPDIDQLIVTAELTFVPYMTPQAHETARKQNEKWEQKRLAFIDDHLNRRQFSYKTPPPWPPTSYRLKSVKETPLLREYAFLWLATEPRRLPTHYFGTLALQTLDLEEISGPTIKIHQAAKDREYRQILAALDKLLSRYV